MKFTILAIITLSILLGVAYTKDGKTPRSEISCDGTVPGLFWDGQKCDRCANSHCFCKEYNGCDKCESGYALGKLSDDDKPRCFKCPAGTRDCCFQGVSTDYKTNKHPERISDTEIDNQGLLIKRAIACVHSTELGETKLFGGFCQTIHGCTKYNEFGQCFECREGYYFNSQVTYGDNVCVKCAPGCKKCRQAGQCDECIDGMYLATNVDRFTFNTRPEGTDSDETKVNISSTCLACEDHCKCSGKITPAGSDSPALCDIGCITKNYVYIEATEAGQQNKCDICPTGCAECEYQEKEAEEGGETTSVLTCIKCLDSYVDEEQNHFYLAPLDDKNECQVCPDNCYECELVDGKPSCLKDKCENGYFPRKHTNADQYYCESCNSDSATKNVKFVMRCKSWNRPTQCGNYGTSFISQAVSYEEQSPYGKLYYLLDIGDGKGECHEVGGFCKSIKRGDSSTGKDVQCASCYEGYHLDPQTGECITCGDLGEGGCAECARDGDQLKCSKCIDIGFFLEDGHCIACASHCNKCEESGSGACDKDSCVNGYYYIAATTDKPSSCDSCDVKQCHKCATKGSCQQCIEGYSLWKRPNMKTDSDNKEDYLCLNCPDYCTLCQDEFNGDRRICTACASGYYLKDGVCHVKLDNCQTYDINGGKCTYCSYGFRVVDGICVSSINVPQGYVNEPFGCTQESRYRDDGDILNMEQFDNWVPPLYDGSANILSVSLLLVLSLFFLA